MQKSTKKLSYGFTMIETLVSLVIISIGILGFALLQIESLKAAKTASERTRAIQFANDMMDRIRTNQLIFDTTNNTLNIRAYNSTTLAGAGSKPAKVCADETETAGTSATPPTSPPTCTLAEMAAYDIWQWRDLIDDPASGLGTNGKSSIEVTNTLPSTITIKIQWTEKSAEKNYTLNTILY